MTARIGEQYMRQLGWYNPEDRNDAVTFIGVGGVGSFAAFAAAKLGIPNITLIDPDDVEIHNQPNQMYDEDDVGAAKVDALTSRLDPDQERITAHYRKAEDTGLPNSGVVVSGLDSMEARQTVWDTCIKFNPAVPLYIDARLGGQLIVVYTVNPTDMEDVEHYEKTLHSDAEGIEAPCTERGIIDVGLACAAIITRQLRRHFAGQDVDSITLLNQESLSLQHGEWVV